MNADGVVAQPDAEARGRSHDAARTVTLAVAGFLSLLGVIRYELQAETVVVVFAVFALVVLIANNAYSLKTMADLGSRARLDEGRLHAYVIEAVDRRALLALLAKTARGRAEEAKGWTEWAASSFRVDSAHPRIHTAIDGEPVVLEPPLEFAIRPRELRVLVPASG